MRIYYEQFDTCINGIHGSDDIPFYFETQNEIRLSKKFVSFTTAGHTDKFIFEKFHYGRIHMGAFSYFAEVLGYYHRDAPKIITYHIVKVDRNFYDLYTLDYSSSDLSEDTTINFQ